MQSAKTDVEPPPDRYLPRRIVFFRDGVSEGEFQTVFTQELGALKGQLNFEREYQATVNKYQATRIRVPQ